MIIDSTIDRMGRGLDYPKEVTSYSASSLFGTSWMRNDSAVGDSEVGSVNQGRGHGLGSVISDITSLNFSALPGDFITGFSTGDLGSYVILLGILILLAPEINPFGKKASRARGIQRARKARIQGQIAQDQSLLKAS